jgi:truncated hemoglobin YjbI
MHWSVGFSDPVPDPMREPTLFEWAGGYPALLDMTRIFYSRYVPADPVVGPLFATMSPDHPERVAAWLSEVFGGPKFYSEHYGGYARMISHHVGKGIRPEQRARWVSLMAQSADDAGLPADPEFRAAFVAYLEWGSRIALENSQADAQPPPNMPMPRWWWVCDATPGSRISALAKPAQAGEAIEPAPLGPDETPRFADHIRPLFRAMDRNSMRFAFDLWSESDLRTHGAAILDRLRAGTMPCDGAWSAEKIAVFERWLEPVSEA